MMTPDFKHRQKNQIPNPTQLSQKQAATAPTPSAYLRKKNPAPAPQVSKPGSNRLLVPRRKELLLSQPTEGQSNQAANAASPTTCKELVLYQSKNKLTEGLILPEAQISVDKLLAQWADKIEKAEQEFVLEETAFERARDRLKDRNGRKILHTMPQPRTTTALMESAGRMVRHSQELSSTGKTRPK